MGGELVSSHFPQKEGSAETNIVSAAPLSYMANLPLVDKTYHPYTDIFKKCLPFYLYIGMTYDQYWNDDVELVKPYREAHQMRLEHENSMAWWQGRYVYDAVTAASPLFRFTMGKHEVRALPYMEKPYPITEKEVEERQREEELRHEMEMRERIKADILEKQLEFKRNKEVKNDG